MNRTVFYAILFGIILFGYVYFQSTRLTSEQKKRELFTEKKKKMDSEYFEDEDEEEGIRKKPKIDLKKRLKDRRKLLEDNDLSDLEYDDEEEEEDQEQEVEEEKKIIRKRPKTTVKKLQENFTTDDKLKVIDDKINEILKLLEKKVSTPSYVEMFQPL